MIPFIHENERGHSYPRELFLNLMSVIKLIILSLFIFPGSVIATLILISYNFNFVAMSKDYYEHQSLLSQTPVEPGYVNYISCEVDSSTEIQIPQPICDTEIVKSISIQEAATETGRGLFSLYISLMIITTSFYVLLLHSRIYFLSSLKRFLKNRKLKKIANDLRLNFTGNYKSLSIHGLLVSDFCYLLRHYSQGRLDSFDDFEKIQSQRDLILQNIQEDIESGNPYELQIGMTSKETAINNIQNLKNIIRAICEYSEACESLYLSAPTNVA